MKKEKAVERIYPELNLEKWSIWQPANSRHKLEQLTMERGFAQVKVSSNSEFGPLTTEDQKVYYALIKLFWETFWKSDGQIPERTYFSDRQVAKILRKKWNGTKVPKSIIESLYRLRFTAFIWKNSYYDSTTKGAINFLDTFTILSELKIAQREVDGAVNKEAGYFRFYDLVAKNLLNGHTKPLLFESLLGFKSDIAQMLYTHLDLVMAHRNNYERRTKELFFDDLQLKGEVYKKLSERKRKLEPALKELRDIHLTTGILTSVSLEKTKDGEDYKLVVRKSPFTPSRKAARPEDKPDRQEAARDQTTLQAEALVKHFYKLFHPEIKKVSPSQKELGQARTLIREHGFEKANYIVDFSRKAAQQTNYKPQTFGGILQYGPTALAECERREEEQKRLKAQVEAERKQEEAAILRLEARLKTLPEVEYRALYETAKAQLLSDMPWLEEHAESTMFRLALNQEMAHNLELQK